jgi:N-acetylneuraminate synthase
MIKIGKREISKNSKPLIVAEIGINHFGSIKLAKKIVDSIKKTGAEAVKVQIHIPDEEMSEEAKKIKPGNSNKNIFNIISENSLNLDEELELKKYIEKKKLIYIATPFSYKAAEWLNSQNIKIFKIGSGECNNLPLIDYVCKFKKPMIVSTGMNSIESVSKTVKLLNKYDIPHVLLHCVNLYPVNYNLIRLNKIPLLRNRFKNSIIGYSDHSIGNSIPIAALGLGAKIIEKHFVINRKKNGPDTICSMNQPELKELIDHSKKIHHALSSIDDEIPQENVTRRFAFHSVVSKLFIKKNEKLNKNNLTTKRPGTGDFPANEIKNLYGKIAKNNIKKNTLIKKKSIK